MGRAFHCATQICFTAYFNKLMRSIWLLKLWLLLSQKMSKKITLYAKIFRKILYVFGLYELFSFLLGVGNKVHGHYHLLFRRSTSSQMINQ